MSAVFAYAGAADLIVWPLLLVVAVAVGVLPRRRSS